MSSTDTLNILVVEDNPADVFLLKRMLRAAPFHIENVYATDRIGQAHQMLTSGNIHLTLLDLSLPDSAGINSFLGIKELAQKIPVIILTGMADTNVALEALKQGAQDYLVKGEFNENLLCKSIQYSLERKQNLETLWESNERFNMVAKATNDAIWDWDLLQNKVLIVGDMYKKLFGYDIVNDLAPDDFWENSLHPDEKERVLARLNKAIYEDKVSTWEDEYRLKRVDNTYAHVRDRAYILYDNIGQPIRAIGAIQDISEKKMAEEMMLAAEEKFRQLKQRQIAEAVLMAQEKERTAMGQELHDNINQILATSKLYLEYAWKEPGRREELIPKTLDTVMLAIEEIRKLSKTLISSNLHTFGLKEAIEDLLSGILVVKPLDAKLDIKDIEPEKLTETMKITILRIIQEQLNNILKHANATSVLVQLSKTGREQVHLVVADNGKGFDLQATRNGIGIINITNRVQLYNGRLEIDTAPGKGCRLEVWL